MNTSLGTPDGFKRQRVLAWIISLCLIVMSFYGFNAPAFVRTVDDGSLPTRILEIAGSQSGLPATQVLTLLCHSVGSKINNPYPIRLSAIISY